MVPRFDVLAVVAVICLLAGCNSGPSASHAGFSAVPPTQQEQMPSTIRPDKGCGGTGGVRVTPCPVRLTKHTEDGIIVTVKGRHVADSEIGHIYSCYNGHTCYVADRVVGSGTEWKILSGPSCGGAIVEFDAMNAHASEIGEFFLKVNNKYCP